MDVQKEVLAFSNWLETNPLDAITQALWFHLVIISLKSDSPWFAVANLTLQARLGITDKTLNKHRNILIQKGRIEYQSQGKQKAGKYRIISLTEHFTGNIPVREGLNGNIPVNLPDSFRISSGFFPDNVPPYIYKDNNRQTDNKHAHANYSDIVNIWKSVFNFDMNMNHREIIDTFIDRDNMSETLIIEAIERVKQADKPNMKYLWRILGTWAKEGIKTISDLVEHEKKRISDENKVIPYRGRKQKTDSSSGRAIPDHVTLDLTAGED